MKLLDTLLDRIGLVRKAHHDQVLRQCHVFALILGAVAKDAGVNVIRNSERVRYKCFTGDVFVVGDNNDLDSITVFGGTVRFNPTAKKNRMSNALVNAPAPTPKN